MHIFLITKLSTDNNDTHSKHEIFNSLTTHFLIKYEYIKIITHTENYPDIHVLHKSITQTTLPKILHKNSGKFHDKTLFILT